MPLLDVRNLKVHFPVRQGAFARATGTVKAVDDVTFDIEPGETLGLVGESGCGKSTLGRAVVRLVEPTDGSIHFDGQNVTDLSKRELRARRRQFQMIFQDPIGSLNPRMTVRQILSEPLDIHRLKTGASERQERIGSLLNEVGLHPDHAARYPHEFSGGQRQRIGIARALAVEPKLIVCDEPVSALDVSIQAQIINLLQELQNELGLAYLFIAHDLAVVEHISRRVLVMYLGKIVESGSSRQVIQEPKHPYTQALISAAPRLDASPKGRIVVGGELPSPINPPSGCAFHTRCPLAQEVCRAEPPPLREIVPGQRAACHFAGD